MGGQPVELALPEDPVLRDPVAGLAQRLRRQAAVMRAAFDTPRHQAGRFEHPQMLRDGRQRHLKRRRQLRHRCFAFGQARQQRAPRAVGQRAEGGVQSRR